MEAPSPALIASARRGDRESIAALAELYMPALQRHARTRTACPQDAEDAVQETLLAFITSVQHLRHSGLQPWLYRILNNKIVDGYREVSRHPVTSLDDELAAASTHADPVESAERHERRRIVREVIAELPAAKRETMTMRFVLDLDVEQISRVRGVTGVKQELYRTTRHIAPELRRRLSENQA